MIYLLRLSDSKWFNNLDIICSDNSLLPVKHQAIIWTNAAILSIGLEVTNTEILIKI